MEKQLGKIEKVWFGYGGYQSAQIGIFFTLSFGKSFSTSTGMSDWDPHLIEWRTDSKWTEADRDASFAKICRYISDLLRDAKVDSIDKLVGKPIEVETDGMILKSWRILTEVL
jgi:hypothetical protein